MKKLMAMFLSAAMVLSFAACGSNNASEQNGTAEAPTQETTETPSESTETTETPEAETTADGQYEIAMITDLGEIDDKSFNQGTWEGIKAYAEANNKTHQYYKPTEQSDDAYLSAIELAVKNGAKIVVTPGYLFENPVGVAQEQYPDIHFVLIDGNPTGGAKENAVGITFAEEQAGYLAGYAAVKDGYTKLGFMGGMAVPAVVRYGYGFVQGANDAAKELGIKVEMKYFYTGGFDASPEAQNTAASWYQSGTEVIFGCGGKVGNSVFNAAEANNGKAIGVDVDQYSESETIITSAMKGLAASVQSVLDQYYNDAFPGAQSLVLGAADNGVEIAMENGRFNKFTKEEYDALYAKLASGEVTLKKDTDESGNPIASPVDLGMTEVTVDFIQQ